MHFRHIVVFLFLIVATYVRSVFALTNIDLLKSTTHSDKSTKSRFNLIDDSTQQDEQENRKTIQKNSETYNKSESSRFFDSESSSESEQENPDIVGTWEGKCNISGINYYIRLSCLEGGICCGLISSLEGSDMFGYQGCDRHFTTSWKSHGTEITIPIPPAEGTNTTNYDEKGIAHINSENIGASSGTLKLELKSPACLVLKSGSGDCTAPLPIGLTPDIPNQLVFNKVGGSKRNNNNQDYYKIQNHIEFNNALEACHRSYWPDLSLLNEIMVDTSKWYGGFSASLYRGTDGKYYLAFEGSPDPLVLTNPRWWPSWIGNNKRESIDQLPASQFEQAINLTKQVVDLLSPASYQNKKSLDYYRFGYSHIILTGHSLGGGLAMAAGTATGLNVITFNSEGVNSYYNGGDGLQWLIPDGPGIANNPHSWHYSIDDDPLTKAILYANKIDNRSPYLASIVNLSRKILFNPLSLLRYRPSSILIAQLPKTELNKHITLKKSLPKVNGHSIDQFDFYLTPISPQSDNIEPWH